MEIENGKYYELGRHALKYSIIQHSTIPLITLVVSGAFGIAASSVTDPSLSSILGEVALVILGLAIIMEMIAAVIARVEYSVSKVMLDDASLRVVLGNIRQEEEMAIPFRRIESVEIKQGMLHQMMHVGHVVIHNNRPWCAQ